jgi:hypothetical protein
MIRTLRGGDVRLATIRLPPLESSIARSGALVASLTDHLPDDARNAAVLVVSELAANAVLHARTEFEVFATADDESIEVVVSDGCGWAARGSGVPTCIGDGLLTVGLLSTCWSTRLDGRGGKQVWVRLQVDDVPAY